MCVTCAAPRDHAEGPWAVLWQSPRGSLLSVMPLDRRGKEASSRVADSISGIHDCRLTVKNERLEGFWDNLSLQFPIKKQFKWEAIEENSLSVVVIML